MAPNTLLHPPLALIPNMTYLVLFLFCLYITKEFEIQKIGLKDAENYIDSIISVTVVDLEGKVIEQSQNTSASNKKNPPYVLFGQTCYIQTPLEKLNHSVIFFEFKHYKPAKKYVSTKCYAFMERDEIKESSNIQLELYAKPTDFTRKKIKLLSVKQLFLHLRLTLRKV